MKNAVLSAVLMLAACGHGPIRRVELSPGIDLSRNSVVVCAMEVEKQKLTCMTPEEAGTALEFR